MREKKMEQAATMNNFDKLLGKNGELIELKKEQILAGAMNIIQQHYADKQNKMEAVAALFGKKLNEPFTIKCERYVFSEKGFGHGNEHGVACHVPDVLERLLAGQVKIDE
jgi:hypothetical protein